MDEYDLIKNYDKTKTYYSKKLNVEEKKHIIENLEKFELVFATDDVLRVL